MNLLIILVNILVTIFCVNSSKDNRNFLKLDERLHKFAKSESEYFRHVDVPNVDKFSKSNEVVLVLINIEPNENTADGETIHKQISRQRPKAETKDQQLKSETIRRQHNDRVRDIINFMTNHMMTTLYLYDEVQRIKKDKIVKDELRRMLSYLEKPKNKAVKMAVLNFFRYIVGDSVIKKEKRLMDPEVNDLLYNVVKDPFNDGVDN